MLCLVLFVSVLLFEPGSLTVRLKHKKNLPDAGFWPAS